jgi:hypothetical protein
MNVNYLPPTEVSQLNALLNLLSNPVKSKELLSKLDQAQQAANQAYAEAQSAKADAEKATAEHDAKKAAAEARLAEVNAALAEHGKRKQRADHDVAQATSAQVALLDKTKELETREACLKAKELEFDQAKTKFKSLMV